MNRIPFCRLAVLTLLLLAPCRPARADFMDWSYHWSITPGSVLTNGSPTDTGSVQVTLAPGGTTGASTLLAASVTTSSSATQANPDSYNVGYNLTLHLTNNQTGDTGQVTFHGTIAGTVWATGANMTSTFSNPLTEQTTIDGHLFSVTIKPTLLTLAAPGSLNPPQITATVSVSNGGGVQPTPEPSTLLLAGLAVPALGLMWRRRNRRVTAGA